MHAPTTVHMDVVYCILRYLKNNLSASHLYTRQPGLCVKGYTNVIRLVPSLIEDLR